MKFILGHQVAVDRSVRGNAVSPNKIAAKGQIIHLDNW